MPSKKRRHRPMNAAQVPLRSSGSSSAWATLLKSSTATCRQAAAARLPGHAVDVGEPRHAPPGDDPRARARRHARRGRQPERGEQHRGAGLAGLRGRLLRSESPSPDLLLRSHLPAVWRLIPIWRAASATPRPDSMRETSVSRPFGVSFVLGCCSTGGLLRYESRQLTACGNPPYLSPADVNNVLALNI